MKYMLIIHQGTTPTPLDPEAWATLSDDEQQAIYQAYQEINQTPGVTPRRRSLRERRAGGQHRVGTVGHAAGHG